jgi:glutamine cyclotransferase
MPITLCCKVGSCRKAAGILIAVVIGIAIVTITTSRKPAPEQIASEPARPTEVPQLQAPPAFYSYEVVHQYPHDPDAVTEGLVYHDGFLYESTGLRGRSSIRKVQLETGEILQRREVDSRYWPYPH